MRLAARRARYEFTVLTKRLRRLGCALNRAEASTSFRDIATSRDELNLAAFAFTRPLATYRPARLRAVDVVTNSARPSFEFTAAAFAGNEQLGHPRAILGTVPVGPFPLWLRQGGGSAVASISSHVPNGH